MKIISIGTATIDYIISTPGKQTGNNTCFDAGRKYTISAPMMRAGGDALNAAVSFARAGFSSALVSEWGADPAGSFLEKVVRREHIRPYITITKQYPTAASFLLVPKNGERTIFVSRGALQDFSFRDVPQQALNHTRYAYMTTGAWSAKSVLRMLRILKKNHIPVMLSPSGYLLDTYRKDLPKLFALSDIVIMNRDEAVHATNTPVSASIHEIFSRLDHLVPHIAIMTCGHEGAYASDGSHIFFAPAFRPRKVVDTTGAGDAFGSGFLTALMESEPRRVSRALFHEESIIYAMHRGSANAASVIEHMGATDGILTTEQFKTDARWKRCAVKVMHTSSL